MIKAKCISCNADILPVTYKKHDGFCAICYKEKKQNELINQFISTPGCPSCDDSRYLFFSWAVAVNEKNNKLNKYKKYLLPIKELKCGKLFKCNICAAFWWLNVENNTMQLITNNRLPLLEQWNIKRYPLSFNELIKLSKIKQTPIDIYGNKSEYAMFPCSVITKNNILYAKSLIQITNLPPLYEDPAFVLFADEIQAIMPSPYSLPIIVRKATAKAQELRMNFSPTLVQSKNGKNFILNNVCHFFDYQGIKGQDVKLLSNVDDFRKIKAEYYPANEDNVYYFHADFDCLTKMFLSLSSI